MTSKFRNFWLDWFLFIVFLTTVASGFLFRLAIPNSNISIFATLDRIVLMSFHTGSGFIGLLGVVIHINWHWSWLKALRGKSIRMLKKPVRANRIINRLIWFTYISANVFGILAWLLSTNLPTPAVKIISGFHGATSIMWLVLLATHLVLHKKWIISACQRNSLIKL